MEKEQEPQGDPRDPSSPAVSAPRRFLGGAERPKIPGREGAALWPPVEDAPGAADGTERDKAAGEGGDKEDKEDKEKEKEEEEAFLVSLYKFMKERRTPIERIPHLGFKQINLWKIYKAVEKLGAYELVTGRRLWKNVYDELGGSPGSTSAATCTRRHYERLVLPYVRHLKGEEDKPLPPSKPRRQYKVSKDDKSKRARKEKGREQAAPDKARPEAGAEDAAERGRGTEGRSSPASPAVPAPSPSGRCPSPCRSHSETYKRLFSSFYSKGNHPIMSPLAKKKLLAQVSKAESLHCHKRHCPEVRRAPSDTVPEAPGAADRAPSVPSEASPAGRDIQGCPQDGAAAPAVFTGYFHAYRSEGPQPAGCPPLWGYFSNLKDFLEPPSAFPEEPEQPAELRGRGCWVPPGATFGQSSRHEDDDDDDDEEDEEPFVPTASSGAVSPLAKQGRAGHRGLAKPRAVVAAPPFTAPPPPDAFEGAALRFPGTFGNPLEQLKSRGVPVAPALSVSPLVIPAFPSPLVVGSELCRPLATGSYGSSARFYPAAPWHGQRSCSSPHGPAFPHHARP
nr:AT-rich interactive domain-containing protein 5A isoform X1 [Taeniopygia guttata]XP_041576469.1 AT-rich interactive domain-containing protein 5A isoform X1 [Taeniopygia guttata]XP_041576470.1 AT-rich interactive domain-containing protein 5A isoform X1 [Taeniopygia guttata]XP_041576471.1 AT-rich interactive domain-containing protein 5A isoform X1 [Taeniopygia guttata]